MKQFAHTLIRLFLYKRLKQHRAVRPHKVKTERYFSNGEDWYKFGI